MFPYAINHISERDGFTSICFGNYCSIYKISRSLHYLGLEEKNYKPCVCLLRSFRNNLTISRTEIITTPLYSVIIMDNAGIKSYSINGQLIKSQSVTVKGNINIIKDN